MKNAMDETTDSTQQISAGGVGVVAGQRWKWNNSPLVPFTVLSLGGKDCACRYDDDYAGRSPYQYEVEMITKGCTLLDAAPLEKLEIGCPAPDLVVRTPRSIQRGDLVVTGIDWGKDVPVKREVGAGGAWINYDTLIDADPFEKYRLRRENGIIIVAAAVTSVRVVGTYNSAKQVEYGTEKTIAEAMAARGVDVEPTTNNQARQSHTRDFVGLWSLRSGR